MGFVAPFMSAFLCNRICRKNVYVAGRSEKLNRLQNQSMLVYIGVLTPKFVF